MKTKITLEIDIQKITDSIMYSEDNYNSISNEVEKKIKNMAVERVKDEILKKVNMDKLVTADYGSKHLTELARKTIKDHLDVFCDSFCQKWISENMKWIIEKSLRSTFDKILVPRLQQMISNMLIVDIESGEEQMKELEEALKNEAQASYEGGKQDAYQEIKKLL